MKKLLLALSLVFIGCDPPKSTYTTCPNGGQCAAIDCTSDSYTHTDCVVAFGKSCPHGYDMVDAKGGNYLIRCHPPEWK